MKLVIAGGGTGGHVYPGIAIAQAVKKISPESEILFVGTANGLEKTAVPKAGFELKCIRVSGIKGHSLFKKLRSLSVLPLALLSSMSILRQFKADAVLGVGGYASGPALAAAWIMGIPTAICEQNSIPGFTNRMLGHLSKRIFGAFSKTTQFFSNKRFEVVGNPLRQEFCTRELTRVSKPVANQLVILGGSLGARPLNDVVPKTVGLLRQRGLVLDVIHQCGKHDVERTKKNYEDAGAQADVRAFVDDMVEVYTKADVLVCRAGATTCSEVTAIGVPSIMVPFPHAIYDHQTENARELANEGATLILPQNQMSPERLANEIFTLFSSSSRREAMASAALKLGKIDAGDKIAKSALNLFSNKGLAND
jgi:UDP-N-acetylglucosamine--N-acetylmuramyl-(pentapeptide) pyrophosphoryl-undecaprenol N-acetylglucosamine transferase